MYRALNDDNVPFVSFPLSQDKSAFYSHRQVSTFFSSSFCTQVFLLERVCGKQSAERRALSTKEAVFPTEEEDVFPGAIRDAMRFIPRLLLVVRETAVGYLQTVHVVLHSM